MRELAHRLRSAMLTLTISPGDSAGSTICATMPMRRTSASTLLSSRPAGGVKSGSGLS
jgi:hypothetical protein